MAGQSCINDCDGGEESGGEEPLFLARQFEKSETELKLSDPMFNFPKRSPESSWESAAANRDGSRTSCNLAVSFDRPHSNAGQCKLAETRDNIFSDQTQPCEESEQKHHVRAESPLRVSEEDSGISSQSSPELEAAPVDSSMSRTHQYRKVLKPLLERKRRARINSCLEELKDLMEATGCNSGEGMQRLEKADVLEVTVRHLRDLKARGRLAAGTDITSTATFRSGFSACAREVSTFITAPGSGVEQQQALHIALGVADGLRRLQEGGAENTFQGTNHHLSNSENIENQRPHQEESHRQVGHQGATQGGGSHQSTDMLPPSNHPLQPSRTGPSLHQQCAATPLHQQPFTSKAVEHSSEASSGNLAPLDLSLK